MKIQQLSDTHGSDYVISDEADLIVHCGDFGNGLYHLYEFVRKCKEKNKPYVLVLGNHDFYGLSMKEAYEQLDKDGIVYLKDGQEFLMNGYRFIGGTLFTNFRANKVTEEQLDINKDYAYKYIYDFHTIKDKFILNKDKQLESTFVTPNHYHTEFNKQYNFINQYRNQDKIIIVTHFPMSLCCLADYWRDHPTASVVNPYFVNDLSLEGFKLALCGHVHHSVDTIIEGCRVIVNPLGYPSEHNNNGYNNALLIDLNEIYG